MDSVAQLLEAYFSARKAVPPPKKYPFDRDPHESARRPPTGCRACGGPHWNKECRHWAAYQEMAKRSAFLAENGASKEDELIYNVAYVAYGQAANNESVSAYDPACDDLQSLDDFLLDLGTDGKPVAVPPANIRARVPAVSMEEVPDEFYTWYAGSPKLPSSVGPLLLGAEEEWEEDVPSMSNESSKETQPDWLDGDVGEAPAPPLRARASKDPAARKPKPAVPEAFHIVPKRNPPPGLSSVGMKVLSVKGRLGQPDETIIILRLDSGASISLVAESYLKRMRHPPKIHSGLKISLAQLTDKSPKIKGYVHMPVRIQAEDGTILVFDAELYVVPDMTVEVLLGEDFQLNNELSVLRSVELGTHVKVGETGFIPSFVRRQSHRRDRANRYRRKKVLASGALHAWKDVLIPAETTVRVPVAGDLQLGREWYVERYLIPQNDETFLTVPNVLLDLRTTDAGRAEPGSIARKSYIPVANPTKVPRLLRAGTLLGYARDPDEYLDKPKNEQQWDRMTAEATALAALV
ncbi:hypothetical protein AURDEDRAFT_62317, partial [Auricularia subglabra TFB-10046 SS5]